MTLADIIVANPSASDWQPLKIDGLNAAIFTNEGHLCAIAWRGQRHVSAPWPWTEAQVERARNVLGSVREMV